MRSDRFLARLLSRSLVRSGFGLRRWSSAIYSGLPAGCNIKPIALPTKSGIWACRQMPTCVSHQQFSTHHGFNASLKTLERIHAAPSQGKSLVQIAEDGNTLQICQDEEDTPIRFNATWLRHNCHCSQCKQPHSGQRLFEPSHLKASYKIQSTSYQDGNILIEWKEDVHITVIPIVFLLLNDYSDAALRSRFQERMPKFVTDAVPTLQYADIMEDDRGLLRWVQHLNEFGLCLIRGLPTEEGTVKNVVERIWPIQKTIYGKVFNVISTEKPINVAYSTAALGLHMDLAYYESPPGFQFLHCLRFDECVEGGESYFVDAWQVVEQMRTAYPREFAGLVRIPATFQKIHFDRESPVYMTYQRPHIVLSSTGQVIAVNWSPPFEGPLKVPQEDVQPYYEAYHRLATMLETAESRVEMHLKPGDMIGFNNRRVLHARNAFQLNGGTRHLQGCYLNVDEMKSRVEVLSRTVGDGTPAKRVFNHCSL